MALAELRHSKGDVLDALIPFFEPILGVLSGKIFDPRQLSTGVGKIYNWRFTADVAEQFIPRLVQKGYLRREGRGVDAFYVVTYEKNRESNSNENDLSNLLNDVIDRFVTYAPVVTDLLHYEKTREQLTDILVRFLLAIGAFGDGALAEARQIASSGPLFSDDLFAQLPEGGEPLEREDRYIAARFVVEMCKEDPQYVDRFRRIASVGLLTEVVEDFIRPTTVPEHTELTIVLDAPLALDYLGLSGRALKDDVRVVLNPLRSIGCRFVVFPTTCDEMKRNLDSMLALPPQNRHGFTHRAMVRGEIEADYVTSVARNPEKALEHSGIDVKFIDLSMYPNSERFFTKEQYEDFLTCVTWVQDLAPREHDATCLALLMRLRGGQNSTDLFQSRYVFVTRNQAFSRELRKYCIQSRLVGDRHEGPVIHHRELATVAWLRTGLDAEENIPKASLLAACERVLGIRKEVTAAVAERLKKLDSREKLEQFEFMLLDQRSVQKLADTTLNDENVVSDANAEKLLEVMRRATVEEEKAKFDTALREKDATYRRAQRELAQQRDAVAATAREQVRERDEQIGAVTKELEQTNQKLQSFERRRAESLRAAVGVVDKKIWWIDAILTGSFVVCGGVAVSIVVVDLVSGNALSWGVVRIIPSFLGILGVVYLVLDILQKPKPGLGNILNVIAPRFIQSELARRGLTGFDLSGIRFVDGRTILPEDFSESWLEDD